jgi:DNA-binding protein H-NS
MKSLVALQAQIQELQKQAADLRSREFRKTVSDIVAHMKAYGISLEDLRIALKKEGAGGGKTAGIAKRGRPKKSDEGTAGGSRKAVPIKYRGPGGETWTGRGKQPRWLKAMLDAGRSADDFKV